MEISNKIADRMRTANLSDNTREYLVSIGMLIDAKCKVHTLVSSMWGEERADIMMQPVFEGLNKAEKEIGQMMCEAITDRMYDTKGTAI